MFDWIGNTRQRQAERMDRPDADPRELADSLRFIRRINAALGYTRAILRHLDGFSRNWPAGHPVRILDVATGSGDIPRAILAWGERRGFDIRITAVDLHPVTLQTAVDRGDSRFQLVRANALALPFAPGSFDYAMTSMFLHHLDEADIVTVLRGMDAIARRGVIISDLLRHRRAYLWIKAISLRSTPMVRHDGPASVAQAFTRDEVLRFRDAAGLGYARYYRHFAHRFVLAGEKRVNSPA